MAGDEMKRWLSEATKTAQTPKGFSHARTRSVVVKKLKTRSRLSTDRLPDKKKNLDSGDGTPQSY